VFQQPLIQLLCCLAGIVVSIQRDTEGCGHAGNLFADLLVDLTGQIFLQSEDGGRCPYAYGIRQSEPGRETDHLDQVPGIPQLSWKGLLIAHGIDSHCAQPPGGHQPGGDVVLLVQYLLLAFGAGCFDRNELANVMHHPQKKGLFRFRVAGQRSQRLGRQCCGQGVPPEVPQLLPLIASKFKHQLSQGGRQ